MRIVFAGTPSFAVPSLQAVVAAGHRPLTVLTQPDRPAGRGRQPSPSAVKQQAAELGLRVEQPVSLRDPASLDLLRALQPELILVVAYGLILPPPVLALPPYGCVNVHASLLPRWRGAAPIQRAIQAGDAQTGISIMQMEAGLDTGPVLLAESVAIEAHETAATLETRLAALGGRLLGHYLDRRPAGPLPARPQDDAQATYAHKIRRDEAPIDWQRPAVEIDRQIRAFNPWPIAETRCNAERLRIWQASAQPRHTEAPPGTVLQAGRGGIVVATGRGTLRIERLQQEGRRALAAADFLNAHDLTAARFE